MPAGATMPLVTAARCRPSAGWAPARRRRSEARPSRWSPGWLTAMSASPKRRKERRSGCPATFSSSPTTPARSAWSRWVTRSSGALASSMPRLARAARVPSDRWSARRRLQHEPDLGQVGRLEGGPHGQDDVGCRNQGGGQLGERACRTGRRPGGPGGLVAGAEGPDLLLAKARVKLPALATASVRETTSGTEVGRLAARSEARKCTASRPDSSATAPRSTSCSASSSVTRVWRAADECLSLLAQLFPCVAGGQSRGQPEVDR